MKTKLTLENIACYLPYDLLVIGNDGFVGKMVAEIGLDTPAVTIVAVVRNNGFYKPLLRPMSQYADINSPSMCELNTDIPIQIEINNLANYKIGLSQVSWGAIQVMQRAKIDYNRLIEAGLALPVTEDNNVYN